MLWLAHNLATCPESPLPSIQSLNHSFYPEILNGPSLQRHRERGKPECECRGTTGALEQALQDASFVNPVRAQCAAPLSTESGDIIWAECSPGGWRLPEGQCCSPSHLSSWETASQVKEGRILVCVCLFMLGTEDWGDSYKFLPNFVYLTKMMHFFFISLLMSAHVNC